MLKHLKSDNMLHPLWTQPFWKPEIVSKVFSSSGFHVVPFLMCLFSSSPLTAYLHLRSAMHPIYWQFAQILSSIFHSFHCRSKCVPGSICIWLNNWLCALSCLLVQRRQWVIWGHTIVVWFVFSSVNVSGWGWHAPFSPFPRCCSYLRWSLTGCISNIIILVDTIESLAHMYPCQNYFQYHTFRLQEMGGNFQET